MRNSEKNPHFNREQCEAALLEFGFSLVEVGTPGAPTPGRIADRLGDIYHALDEGLAHDNREQVIAATRALRRLLLALDAYDGWMQHPEAFQ